MNIWVDQLQLRVASFRKEKTSWTAEAVTLRGEVKDAKVRSFISIASLIPSAHV